MNKKTSAGTSQGREGPISSSGITSRQSHENFILFVYLTALAFDPQISTGLPRSRESHGILTISGISGKVATLYIHSN